MKFSKIINSRQKGFTLIELLVVIGILAILLAITLIAINPAKQFKQANDTKRRSDVNTMLNAISQYMADNKGTVPPGITLVDQVISNTAANICSSLVTRYIAALPVDPLTGGGVAITDCAAAYNTSYNVIQSSTDNRITVRAPNTENPPEIMVSR